MAHSFSRMALVMLAMMISCSVWAQDIFIGGHKAVFDKLNNQWLCSIPRECFGNDWDAVVTVDSTWTAFYVDGMDFVNGDTVTFAGIEGGKSYQFNAVNPDGKIIGSITFTWLPILEIKGTFGYEYAPGTVSLYTPDETEDKIDMLAKLKWRGGITNTDVKNKRNYHIKFLDENGEKKNRRLLGMRKDNHWKLDAGQIDPLRIRNRVCTDLWLDMSRDPWYKSMDSTVINGSRGKITEVILNGEYHGIYGLIEPLDRKQLALVKHDTISGEFHGQQWTAKDRKPLYVLPPFNNYSATWNGYEVCYPDVEDVLPTDWSTLYNAFEFARRMDAADDWQTLTDSIGYYFDVPILQDYYIFIVALQAIDNEIKNIYYSCYDKTLDKRLTMTPWDLDISVGARSIAGLNVSPERPVNWIMHIAMGDVCNSSRLNRRQVIDRYWQLRKTWLNTDSLISRFRTVVDELEMCGASAREEARWSQDSDLGGKVLDISNEMEYVADWISRRMAYLDENVFARLRGDVNDDGLVNITDVTMIIKYLLGGSEINEANADVDEDGFISITDVTALIARLLVD